MAPCRKHEVRFSLVFGQPVPEKLVFAYGKSSACTYSSCHSAGKFSHHLFCAIGPVKTYSVRVGDMRRSAIAICRVRKLRRHLQADRQAWQIARLDGEDGTRAALDLTSLLSRVVSRSPRGSSLGSDSASDRLVDSRCSTIAACNPGWRRSGRPGLYRRPQGLGPPFCPRIQYHVESVLRCTIASTSNSGACQLGGGHSESWKAHHYALDHGALGGAWRTDTVRT